MGDKSEWQLFTSQGLVLIAVLNQPGLTIREISLCLHLTEHTVYQALTDLEAAGYLQRERIGRRSYYRIDQSRSLKMPTVAATALLARLTVASLKSPTIAEFEAESQELACRNLPAALAELRQPLEFGDPLNFGS